MRKPLVTFLAEHLADWAGSQEFGQLVLDVPQLGVELLRSTVESAATVKVAESQCTVVGKTKGSKRKRAAY